MNNSVDATWEGSDAVVSVLHSCAGVATQILITAKKDSSSVLIDAGDGCLRDLIDREFIFDDLKGILFTHTHYDHCSGLFGLLSFLTVVCRRKQALAVFTPASCEEVTRQLSLWREAFAQRETYEVTHHRLACDEAGSITDFVFTAHAAAHPSSARSRCVINGAVAVPPEAERGLLYNIQVGQDKLLMCFDSGMTDDLFRLAEGVDLALVEALLSARNESVGRVHMTEEEARSVGEKASSYILVHRGIEDNYFRKLTCSDRE